MAEPTPSVAEGATPSAAEATPSAAETTPAHGENHKPENDAEAASVASSLTGMRMSVPEATADGDEEEVESDILRLGDSNDNKDDDGHSDDSEREPRLTSEEPRFVAVCSWLLFFCSS